jgi:uncharacterized membrane protein
LDWIPWVAALAYAIVYSWLGLVRYNSYHASYDLGLFTQAITSAFGGFYSTPEGTNHFAFHFSPILYILAPFLWFWKSPVVLIVAGSVACGLAIPPIYYIAARRVPQHVAAVIAVIAALYPALGGVSFIDFTENVFAPAAAAWLLWAIDGRRMVLAGCFALLCLSIKEDQALFMAFLGALGIVYFLRRGEQTWAIFSAVLAAVAIATIALFLTVVRHATGVSYGYPSIRDFYGGESAVQLAVGLLSPQKLEYVASALLPLLGLCLLSESVLLALPGLAECLLSRVPVVYTLGQHYAATWVPYVLVAFAMGVARLWKRASQAAAVLLVVSLLVSVYINVAKSPNDWSANLSPRTSSDEALDAFIARLPTNSSVTAFARTFAHLGLHPNATPYAETPTDYAILYGDRDFADWEARERKFVDLQRYRLIEKVGTVEIYRRR